MVKRQHKAPQILTGDRTIPSHLLVVNHTQSNLCNALQGNLGRKAIEAY